MRRRYLDSYCTSRVLLLLQGLILLNMVALSHLEAWDTSQGCPWKFSENPWEALRDVINALGKSNQCFGKMDDFLSPGLQELLSAIFSKDPSARPTADEILGGSWMTHGGLFSVALASGDVAKSQPLANAARIAAALEIR